MLIRLVTLDSFQRAFQYKILNNVLYLNSKLFHFGLHHTSLCPFCKGKEETVEHLFSECTVTNNLWRNLDNFHGNHLQLLTLTPQAAFLGFIGNTNDLSIQNQLLLLLKIYLYKNRSNGVVHLNILITEIKKVRDIEFIAANSNPKKLKRARLKWSKVNGKIPV